MFDSLDQPLKSNFILWRDAIFLLVFGACLQIVFWVETHPGSSGSQFITKYFTPNQPSANTEIVDSGFVITTPLYNYLEANKAANDWCAFFNSIFLFVPMMYALKVTFWDAE